MAGDREFPEEAGQERPGLGSLLLPPCLPCSLPSMEILGLGPTPWLALPRIWLSVCPHCLQWPRGSGLHNVIALRTPHPCLDTAAPWEPRADTCPEPGGSWLEHCNNANPCPPPKPLTHLLTPTLQSQKAGSLAREPLPRPLTALAECPLPARPRTQKRGSQGPLGLGTGWLRTAGPEPNQQRCFQPCPSLLLGPF